MGLMNWRMALTTLALGTVLFTGAWAQDKAANEKDASSEAQASAGGDLERQYTAVSNARTKAELALRDARKALISRRETLTDVFASTEAAKEKTLQGLAAALQNEQKKPATQQDPTAVQSLTQQAATVTADWQKYLTADRAAAEARLTAAGQVVTDSTTAYNNANTMEASWKNLEMDLAPVEHAYNGLTKRLADARQEMNKAVEDLRQKKTQWTAMAEKPATAASAAPTP